MPPVAPARGKLLRRLKLTPRTVALGAAGLVVGFVLLRGRGQQEDPYGVLSDPEAAAPPLTEDPGAGGGAAVDLSGVEGALGEVGGLLSLQSSTLADISTSLADLAASGQGDGGGGFVEPPFFDYFEPPVPSYGDAELSGASSTSSAPTTPGAQAAQTFRYFGETFGAGDRAKFEAYARVRGSNIKSIYASNTRIQDVFGIGPSVKPLPRAQVPIAAARKAAGLPPKKPVPAKGAGGQAPRPAPGNARASSAYSFTLPSGEKLRTKQRAQAIAKQQGLTLAKWRQKHAGLNFSRLA